jgi:ATP-dependent RNA helicase DDX3X
MSTNGLDMEDVATALNDATEVANNTTSAKNEGAHALARNKGWIKPQEFDYDAYNASGKGTGTGQVVKGDWSHNAGKYEWKEEYGDVGPPSAELEDQLFRSELTNRQGLKFDKYILDMRNHFVV